MITDVEAIDRTWSKVKQPNLSEDTQFPNYWSYSNEPENLLEDPLGSPKPNFSRTAFHPQHMGYSKPLVLANPYYVKPEVSTDHEGKIHIASQGVDDGETQDYSDIVPIEERETEFRAVEAQKSSGVKVESVTHNLNLESNDEHPPVTRKALLKPSNACLICGRRYSHKKNLKWHIKQTHSPNGPVRYTCYHCSRDYAKKNTLIEHILSNHLTVPREEVQCPQCGRSYCSISNARRHIKLKHSIVPVKYWCYHCGSRFAEKWTLTKHIVNDHMAGRKGEIRCQQCGRHYRHLKNLKCHWKQKHSPSGPIRFTFFYRGRYYEKECTLPKHETNTNLTEPQDEKQCLLCGCRYKHLKNLKWHLRQKHSPNGPVRYTCYHCWKDYAKKNTLTVHIVNNHLKGH